MKEFSTWLSSSSSGGYGNCFPPTETILLLNHFADFFDLNRSVQPFFDFFEDFILFVFNHFICSVKHSNTTFIIFIFDSIFAMTSFADSQCKEVYCIFCFVYLRSFDLFILSLVGKSCAKIYNSNINCCYIQKYKHQSIVQINDICKLG